ncbi:hypothetical protein [Mesobacterium pallidum]|uniref:hypothetical protein n=1 Tax=Mesobacterium pallidum TaxID=2872037 RepID=UPI001EE23878|nr:hypothetical protein [Mesobacterium pallidum]
MKQVSEDDQRGLIAEAYAIEGLTEAEARAIFFDWALGLAGVEPTEAIGRLHSVYVESHPQHPMTAVLAAGKTQAEAPRRRRGWRGRREGGGA